MEQRSAKQKIISYTAAKRIAAMHRRHGQTVVFKSGCFDVVHIAHARMLAAAKKFADVLVVGIGSDKTLRGLKGPGRPIFHERDRAEMVASLACVDYVVILKEPLVGRIDHEKIISLIRPTYYFLPPDDKALLEKRALAKKYGVTLKLKKQLRSRYTGEEFSSSAIIERVQALG